MRWWIVLCCLAAAPPVSAGDDEQLTPDQLPPEMTRHIREGFRAEPLHARKEVEGDRACYVVTASYQGQAVDIYASPDWLTLVRKTEAFSLARWTGHVADGALFLLLPGVVAGAVARRAVRAKRGRSLSALEGWLSAWAGAVLGLGIVVGLVVSNLATVRPREKDWAVLGGYCVAWGAIAASAVEVVALAAQRSRVGAARRRWIVGCCVIAAVSLALTIPLDILRIERENRTLKKWVLRPPAE